MTWIDPAFPSNGMVQWHRTLSLGDEMSWHGDRSGVTFGGIVRWHRTDG
jgi:hypothetical protein